MRISAALSWWDESPEDLAACVRGVGNIADRIVAFDGAYKRYPGAQPRSPDGQAEAIRDTASDVGLECVVYQPERVWAGQVEKRSALLGKAAEGSDWIAIVDADHIIHTEREAARAELAAIGPEVDVVSVTLYTPHDDSRALSETAATNWHARLSEHRVDIGHFFRALPGIHAYRFHWWYAATKDGRKIGLWYGGGGPGDLPSAPHRRLSTPYVIEHRSLFRDERHILDNRAFCNDREMVIKLTDQEDDIEGLPAPVFDYTTVPY